MLWNIISCDNCNGNSQCMEKSHISSDQKNEFDKNGYIIVENLFDNEEMEILDKTIESDTKIPLRKWKMSDGDERYSELIIWKYLSNDTYGNFMGSERVVNIMHKLLNCHTINDVVHYHTKLMLKHAQIGGKFNWHQDYGYWYQNGILYPNLITLFIAIDPCTQKNGCLQVLKGSQSMGRIEHKLVGGQTGADMERVNLIKQDVDTVQVELKTGDTVFFHSNLLHCSPANLSNNRRFALLAAYSCRNNKIYKEHHHYYTDINVKSDEEIKNMGIVPTVTEEIFMDPKGKVDTVVIEKE